MILLKDLKEGNAFKTSGQIVFRCNGDISPNFIPVIPIKQYFLIDKASDVQPISHVTSYSASKTPQSKKQLMTVPVGTICWTCNPLGLNQLIITTKNMQAEVMMVASLGEAKLMDALSRVMDLGPVDQYAGPNMAFDQLRMCPNCLNLTYKGELQHEDGESFVNGTCLNCKCTVRINW